MATNRNEKGNNVLDDVIQNVEYAHPRTETEAYEKIIESIKDAGWEVDGDYTEQTIDITGFSPCDRKFEFSVSFENPFELQQKIADHCDEFETGEYIDTWKDVYEDDLSQYYKTLGYSPFKGVENDTAILVKDADAIQEMFDDLQEGVCAVYTNDLKKSTEQLVDEIKEVSDSYWNDVEITNDNGQYHADFTGCYSSVLNDTPVFSFDFNNATELKEKINTFADEFDIDTFTKDYVKSDEVDKEILESEYEETSQILHDFKEEINEIDTSKELIEKPSSISRDDEER